MDRRFGSAARIGRAAGGTLFALLTAVFLSACGYQMAGRGDLPADTQTVAVRMLENRSSETGLETLVTNALINELNRRRQGSVVDEERADAVLTGTIDALTWDTVAHRGVNVASERRVYMTISLTLTDRSGHVLWKRSGLRGEQTFDAVDDKIATEFNRRQAITVLAQQVAENVYRGLTDNF